MILITICFIVTRFYKSVFLSTTLDLPVILDGQFCSNTQKALDEYVETCKKFSLDGVGG
jgi:hypothetical protein